MIETKQNQVISVANMFFRDIRIILAVWLTCIVVAVIAALLMSKTYEAKSTLLVKFGREYIYRAETGDQRSTTSRRTDMEEAINSEVQILASRDLKQQVVESIGIERLYPDLLETELPMDYAIQRLGSALSIRSIDRSSIINLYLQHEQPEMAAETLNQFVDLFITKRLEVYRNSDVPFFSEQVDHLTAELREVEKQFATFKAENKIFELSGQSKLLVEQRNKLATSLTDAQRQISELREQYASTVQHLGQLPKTVVLYKDEDQGKMLDDARQTLFDLKLEEKRLLGSYREDSKAVTNIRFKIQQISELLATEENDVSGQSVRTGPSKIYENVRVKQLEVETELASLEARRATVLAQIEEIESEIIRMTSLNSRHDEMSRDIAIKRTALQAQLTNLADAQAYAALDNQNRSNIRVVQSAVPPTSALGLSRKSKVMLAVPLGLLAGLLVAFGLNFFRSTVSEARTVERKSGLEVLATRNRID